MRGRASEVWLQRFKRAWERRSGRRWAALSPAEEQALISQAHSLHSVGFNTDRAAWMAVPRLGEPGFARNPDYSKEDRKRFLELMATLEGVGSFGPGEFYRPLVEKGKQAALHGSDADILSVATDIAGSLYVNMGRKAEDVKRELYQRYFHMGYEAPEFRHGVRDLRQSGRRPAPRSRKIQWKHMRNPRGRRKGWISLYEAQGTGGNAFILVDNDTGDDQIVQTDWDFPGLASTFGWVPCRKCRATDGTVDCAHKTASQMISEAYDYLMAHLGKQVPDPGYFGREANPAPSGRRRDYRRNPDQLTEWIEGVLANDEASTDEELVELFVTEGKLDRATAEAWVAQRTKYMMGIVDLPGGGRQTYQSYHADRRRMGRRNPDYSKIKGFEPWMAQDPQFVQAVEKYREFHGCMPASISRKDIPGLGGPDGRQFLVQMGKAMDTTYRPTHRKSSKYGSAYIHEFGEGLGRKPKDADLPDQACTPDGKNLLTFGGKFEVKDWVRR